MSFIRTVLGDIAPEDLGVCYSHEHIIMDASYMTEQNPDFLLNSVDCGLRELKELKKMGVSAVVDSMPCNGARNVAKLAAISDESGIHIVAPTGVHLRKYYEPGHWDRFYHHEQLAEIFVAEIEDGIDAHNYNGPFPSRMSCRAGLIKVASTQQFNGQALQSFAAAAVAQKQTGCPILTHAEEGETALKQAQFLQQHSADLNHVVLSHLDRKPDANYHREVLKTGVTIEYDSHFRWGNKQPNPTLELLRELLPEFPDQIVLGMDAARRSYWKSYGGNPGLSYLYGNFRHQMSEAGIGDELIHKVFVSTPARVYSFKEKS